jgi:simple sugar transport system substrate-binding protein
MVANAVIRKYSPKIGSEAIVFGVDPFANPSRYQRTKGNIDGLKKGGLIVHEITMPKEVEKDIKSVVAQKMISDALIKYPNVKYIITDHGALTASMPLHLKSLGKKPGDIIVAGFDLSPDTVSGIKSGYLGLVLDQQPYLQGYLPILQSCLTKKYGFAGLYVDTGTGLIDSSNVDLVAGLAAKKIR